VAGEFGGFVVTGEQGAVGHHQLHLHPDRIGGGLSGGALHQGVGHHLTPGALIATGAGGVGGLGQCGVDRDPLGGGQQGTEPGHGVRCGAQGDPPVGGGFGGPVGHRVRVQPVPDPPCFAAIARSPNDPMPPG